MYQSNQRIKGWRITERICEICGEVFHPVNNTQKICGKVHYRNCVICGKQFIVSPTAYSKERAVTCSNSCHGVLANQRQSQETRDEITRQRRLMRFNGDADRVALCESFTEDPLSFIKQHYASTKPTLYELSQKVGLAECTVGQVLLSKNATSAVHYRVSRMEQEVMEFLASANPELKVVHNTDRVITPYQLDIWLPEINIGIECNPTSSHNSSFNFMDVENNSTPVKYHQMKTDLCEEKGIFLFHIFGYEWSHRRHIIESMLRNLVHKNSAIMYARECTVREVSGGDTRLFLDTNHRQGNVNSPIRLGLYHNDELVSLMTFGKMRNTIGTDNTDLDDCYELVRFCNKLNTSVVGGASKLFSHFIKEYSPQRVRSFSDRAHTRGTLYQNLGFNEIRRSDPGYVWVDTVSDIAYSRVNAQKQNIVKFLGDSDIDLSQTEKQIMENHQFAQVFDSGTITWEWTNQ